MEEGGDKGALDAYNDLTGDTIPTCRRTFSEHEPAGGADAARGQAVQGRRDEAEAVLDATKDEKQRGMLDVYLPQTKLRKATSRTWKPS